MGENTPSLGAIFLAFLKMGALAFGGVYSMLAFFQRELVDRRGWMDQDGFADAVSIGQMTPGPPIVNTGVFVGYSLRGVPGALAAVAGLVLPGFFLVIGIGFVYVEYRDLPVVVSVLRGIGAAVIGLLLSVVYRLGRSAVRAPFDMALVVGSLALIALFKANPIAIIVGSGLLGYIVHGRSVVKEAG